MSRFLNITFTASLFVGLVLGVTIVVGQVLGIIFLSGSLITSVGKLTTWATYGFSVAGLLAFTLGYVDKFKMTE